MLHLNVPDCIWCFRLPQTNPFWALTTTPAIIFWICFAKVSHFCILRLKVNKLTDLILSNLSEGNFWVMHLSLSSNTSWFSGCCCVFLSCNSSVNNLAVMKFSASSSLVVTRKATLSPGCKVTIYSWGDATRPRNTVGFATGQENAAWLHPFTVLSSWASCIDVIISKVKAVQPADSQLQAAEWLGVKQGLLRFPTGIQAAISREQKNRDWI